MSNVLIQNVDSEKDIAVEIRRGESVLETVYIGLEDTVQLAVGGGQSLVIVDNYTGVAHADEAAAVAALNATDDENAAPDAAADTPVPAEAVVADDIANTPKPPVDASESPAAADPEAKIPSLDWGDRFPMSER